MTTTVTVLGPDTFRDTKTVRAMLDAVAVEYRKQQVKRTRRQYARAWKAWRKACAIRAAHRGSAPVKAWYDECRVMLARAERAHRRALHNAA